MGNVITEKHAPFEHVGSLVFAFFRIPLDARSSHPTEFSNGGLGARLQGLLREGLSVKSLSSAVHLRIAQTEDVERRARLLAFPELGAERMDFADDLGVADGDLVRGDANRETVLLVQGLHIVPSCAGDVVPL